MAATAQVWAYEWPGVQSTITGPTSEAKARAAIREKHQLKWVPNGATVVRLADYRPAAAETPTTEVGFQVEEAPSIPARQNPEALSQAVVEAIASTSVWKPTEAGAKLNPRWWKGAAYLRHPAISPARPRRDKDADAYAKRVQPILNRAMGDAKACLDVIGRGFGDGYYVVATDGHRALCRRGEAKNPSSPLKIGCVTDDHACFYVDDAMMLALQRAKAVAGSGKPAPVIRLAVNPTKQEAHIWARDTSEWGCESHETVPLDGGLVGTWFSVNVNYLLDGLGRPSRLWYKPHSDTPAPIIFESSDQEWRYVLMPVREDTHHWRTRATV